MNSQYRKNLKDAMTACKNYTDKKIEDLKWYLGTYDLSVETINGTTMLLPTPANTIQGTMDRVDGNSEKSENLAVFDDVAETTINGVKVKYQDGAVYLDGTASEQFKVVVQFKQPIYANKDYYVKLFTSGTTTATNPKAIGETSADVRLLIPSTTTFNVTYNINYFWFSAGSGTVWTNYVVKPMIVSGSTEPTTYKQGYTGIHNFAWTGVKVEGSNLFDASTIRYGYYGGGTSSEPTNYSSQYISVAPSTTYYISGTIGTYHLVQCFDVNKTFVSTLINNNTTRTFTVPNNAYYIMYSANVGNGRNVPSTIMISKGNSAPSDYVPYITPTTTTIDLSSILYNGSPLFEGNSLKAVNDVKDILTPYKATKKLGYVDLGTLNWSVDGENLFSTNISLAKANALCLIGSNQYSLDVDSTITDKEYRFGTSSNNFYIRDYSISTTSAFATAMSGVYLVYELATPIEADIDFSQLVKFEAYSNGSITLVNTNNQDTTSTFKYLKEVAE